MICHRHGIYQSLTFLWAVSHLLGTKPRSGGSLPWLSTARYLQHRLHIQTKCTQTHSFKLRNRKLVSLLLAVYQSPSASSRSVVIFVLKVKSPFRHVWEAYLTYEKKYSFLINIRNCKINKCIHYFTLLQRNIFIMVLKSCDCFVEMSVSAECQK